MIPKNKGIIINDNLTMKRLRGYVMVMGLCLGDLLKTLIILKIYGKNGINVHKKLSKNLTN